jgi:uncharacterized protein (TIGR03067 family)
MNMLIAGLAIIVAAPGAKDPPKKEPPSLVGVWIGESGIKGGMPSPPEDASMEFTKDGKLTFKEKGKEIPGTYKTDAKKSPNELDIELSAGGMNLSLPGIYKIEGDTLTICFAFMGERPSKFESPAGSMIMLITLKREKKKE